MSLNKTVFVVCGPTASGKTAFAHHLAKKYNGEIINADSMQFYDSLPILTASPDIALKSELPYHLYNFLNIFEGFSVFKYVECVTPIIQDIINRNKHPIIVGGSGLYVSALLNGYHNIPTVCNKTRKKALALYTHIGKEKFFQKLKSVDPIAAQILNINDTQRILRAYEVTMQFGRSIFSIHKEAKIMPLAQYNAKVLYLHPTRELLHKMCNERLLSIFKSGALEEAKSIMDTYLTLSAELQKLELFDINRDTYPNKSTYFKYLQNYINALLKKQKHKAGNTVAIHQNTPLCIIGLAELLLHIQGLIDINDAINLAQAKTRQYAKRQVTWFTNQVTEKITLPYSNELEFLQLLNYQNYG